MMRHACAVGCLALLCAGSVFAAPGTEVVRLQTRRVNKARYFHVALATPEDFAFPELDQRIRPTRGRLPHAGEALRRQLGALPRLVPLDGQATVHYDPPADLPPGRDEPLEFAGRIDGDRPMRFLLLYPGPARETGGPLGKLLTLPAAREVEVRLDWDSARRATDDLQHRWARARAFHFAVREVQTPGVGYFTFAREAIDRKYGASVPALVEAPEVPQQALRERMYALTTGASALEESLALRRSLLSREDRGERTVPVSSLPGITIAEHPWKKMLAGKEPRSEPLAELVPHDNYYFTLHSPETYLPAVTLLEQWGGSVLGPITIQERDHRVRARYEKQLCLPDADLIRALNPRLIRGIAVTGSDLYFQAGTDVTVLFEASDVGLLLRAFDLFLDRVRAEQGEALRERKGNHRGVEVRSFVTPHREVSLHRAIVGNVIVCSNSPVAVRRVIDVARGKRESLADSLDFQYMRTIFVRDKEREDGFAFLPDAFIRRLVGPATRIKAKRRLEALAALTEASHAALFVAQETGKLPANRGQLLRGAELEPDQLRDAEGQRVRWDGRRAFSPTYNTLAFATPLVELPIDRVTREEDRAYRAFRRGYLNLWRRFFDPVGIRFTLAPGQVKVDTYILPLLANSQYNSLRNPAGNIPTAYRLADLPASSMAQFLFAAWGSEPREKRMWWGSLHLDGELDLEAWVKLQIRRELDPWYVGGKEYGRLFWQLPLTLASGPHKDVEAYAKSQSEWWHNTPLSAGPSKSSRYRGVTIHRAPVKEDYYFKQLVPLIDLVVQDSPDNVFIQLLNAMPRKVAPRAIYQASVGDFYYLAFNKRALKRRIDSALARAGKGGKETEVNAALFLAPPRGKAGGAFRLYLEWENQCKALANANVWEALHAIDGVADEKQARKDALALDLLGFVPASPDGAGYVFDPRRGEVRNTRHGSFRSPAVARDLDPRSPLGRLLGPLRSVRADLRFREDGVHTILTIDRR
jgi:hypothetical protein